MAESPSLLDKDLSEHRIQDLANPDAMAALFAELGYRTESRIAQTPGNLGIHSEELRRDIRSIQLLAEQEDGFQIYLFDLRTVKVAHRQLLARAFRDRVGIFLLVLTSDFDKTDFVFLERYLPAAQEEILPGISPKLFGHKLRPLTHTVQRRNPTAQDLRLLRRFTWTEADGYAQHDKVVHAYGVVYWSEQFFNNKALFSDYYLLHRFRERSEWDEDPKPVFRELRQLYRDGATGVASKKIQDRKSLLSDFLAPVLSALGFAFEPGARGSGRPRLQKEPTDLPLYAPGGDTLLARCLFFPWGRALDRKDDLRDKEKPDVNPGVLVVYLLETGDAPWVILTNGRLWRLYARRAHSRATNYYEIDLGEVLDATGPFAADPNESFRYFWLLFRRKSFELQPFERDGQAIQESLLDHLRAESEAFARKLGDNLKNKIFEEVFPSLATGFASDLRRNTAAEELSQDDLDLVFRGTLTFLYRLLFLLYAEARDLLPVREVRGYYEASLAKLKKEIEGIAGPAFVETRRKIEERFRADSYEVYEHFTRLFRVIDVGDADLNVPRYNGGLFLSEPKEDDASPEAEAARFLLKNRVADAPLALAIDRLARDEDDKSKALIPIDYKSLGVRQLGSIYEGLLEFRLRVAREEMAIVKGKKKTEEVVPLGEARKGKKPILKEGRAADARERILKIGTFYLENDKRERKVTGSYYTPDFVVEYIVEKTVGPILKEKLEALRPKLREAEQWHRKRISWARSKGEAVSKYEFGPAVENEWRRLVEKTFDLKVLDPAMGSGHFLVEAVDYITDEILDFLSQYPWNPVFAHLAYLRKIILDDMERQGVSIDERKLTDVNLLKRHVLKRCIFGVDVNPMAVELAKVSLWLDCFTLGAPLSFLDHHLRCGNSILGVTVKEVEDAILLSLFGSRFDGLVDATERMVEIAFMPDVTSSQARESREAFQRASEALSPFKRHLDIYTTRWFSGSASTGGGKKGRGFTEIDFLKSPEAQVFLSAASPEKEREALGILPARERALAETALRKARKMSFFHWEIGFPEVFYGFQPGKEKLFIRQDNGGFDAVIGNPPWVRQEGLKEMKTTLAALFQEVFDSEADIYVYILARGIQLLCQGGRLGMILQNKWFKAGYAESLRRYLAHDMNLHEIINFGHAPLFDADTFPCILLLGKSNSENGAAEESASVDFLEVDRGELYSLDLHFYGRDRKQSVSIERLSAKGWELLTRELSGLMEKVRSAGIPLRKFSGSPQYGIKTGLNEAFLVDQSVRDRIVSEDSNCKEIIKKFFRGEHIKRWHSPWGGDWIILLKSSHNHDWPWSVAANENEAERLFGSAYPSLYKWMKSFEDDLRRRQDHGRFWWELRACDYYDEFEAPKIVYQEIQFHSRFALDDAGLFSNNKVFFLPTDSIFTLSILNSSLMWWYLFQFMGHQKDDALAMQAFRFEQVPICEPRGNWKDEIEVLGSHLLAQAKKVDEHISQFNSRILDHLGYRKLPASLETYWIMDERAFLLSLARKPSAQSLFGESALLKDFRESRQMLRDLRRSACLSEVRLHQAVFDLYGLTPEEVRLVRKTAPPRDPLTLTEKELALLERD